LVGTYALSETGPDGFATYRIDASGVERLSLKGMDAPGVPDYDFDAWRKAVGLKVATAMFDDLAQDASPEWEDQLTRKPISGLGGLRDVRVVE
jgi:hypothetical protein